MVFFQCSELDKNQKDVFVGETKVTAGDSFLEPENVRRMDAGVLNYKHVIMAALILLISAAVYSFQRQGLHL